MPTPDAWHGLGRCDVGGDYAYPDLSGPAVYRPPCPQPPTYRYRSRCAVDEHWGHRCTQHAGWLDPSACTVEPLTRPTPRSGTSPATPTERERP